MRKKTGQYVGNWSETNQIVKVIGSDYRLVIRA